MADRPADWDRLLLGHGDDDGEGGEGGEVSDVYTTLEMGMGYFHHIIEDHLEQLHEKGLEGMLHMTQLFFLGSIAESLEKLTVTQGAIAHHQIMPEYGQITRTLQDLQQEEAGYKAREEKVMGVECPYCAAGEGELCITASGTVYPPFHSLRWKKAKA